MKTESRSLSILQGFQKLGLIRDAFKPHAWFSGLEPTGNTAEIPAFSQAKASRALTEAKKAEAYAAAQRIFSAPR